MTEDTFKSETDLDIALEKLCRMLCDKGAMKKEDMHNAIQKIKQALKGVYGENLTNVPQALFTDSTKRQNLIVGLITAPLMEKIPALRFDLVLFFKAQLQPEETKKLFKAFLIGLNKLEPDPNKRRKDEDIDKEADILLEKFAQFKKGKELKTADNKSARDDVDEMFEVLFGMTRLGMPVVLTINKGNTAGVVDSYSASGLASGSIHDNRGFGGDSTTDPYVTAMAKERLSDLAGIGEAIIKDLIASKIIKPSSTPTLMPGKL